jgi:chromosome partitioning protein
LRFLVFALYLPDGYHHRSLQSEGRCGKSTLSLLIAREYANAGWSVKIADLDVGQGTIFNWQGRRLQNMHNPIIPVERFGNLCGFTGHAYGRSAARGPHSLQAGKDEVTTARNNEIR